MLLIDSAQLTHIQTLFSDNIKAIPLANVTSLIQPFDQGLLENLKKLYTVLAKTLTEGSEGKLVAECLKKVALNKSVYQIAMTWIL